MVELLKVAEGKVTEVLTHECKEVIRQSPPQVWTPEVPVHSVIEPSEFVLGIMEFVKVSGWPTRLTSTVRIIAEQDTLHLLATEAKHRCGKPAFLLEIAPLAATDDANETMLLKQSLRASSEDKKFPSMPAEL